MKKFVSCILAAAVLIGTLGSAPAVLAETTDKTEAGLIYDFTVPDNISSVYKAGDNTNIEYDSGAQAMKITAVDQEAENPMRFAVQPKSCSTSEYPVLAIRLRINDTDMKYGATYVEGTGRGLYETNDSWYRCPFEGEYSFTERWQTLIIDTTDYYNETDWPNRCFFEDWYSMTFCLAEEGSLSDESAVYVRWVGVFADVESAQSFELSPYMETAGLLYDFTDEDGLDTLNVLGDANKEYDSSVGTAKITAQSASDLQVVLLPEAVPVIYYPILAIRVKVENTQNKYGNTYINGTDLGRGEDKNGWMYCPFEGSYNGSDGWQTLIVDTTGYCTDAWPNRCFAGDWSSMLFTLAAADSVSAGDSVYIQWVGVFSSKEDAETYAAANSLVTAGMLYSFTDAESTDKAIVDSATTQKQFDEASGALKLTSKDISAENPLMFRVEPKSGADIKEYPVIAMRVRLSDAGIEYNKTLTKTSGSSKVDTSPLFEYTLPSASYEQTTAWQTVIIDTSSMNYRNFKGDWYVLGFWPAKAATVSETSAVYVKWCGAFRNTFEAEEYSQAFALKEKRSDINCSLSATEQNGEITVSLTADTMYTYMNGTIGYDDTRVSFEGVKSGNVTVDTRTSGKLGFSVLCGDWSEPVRLCFKMTGAGGGNLCFTLSEDTECSVCNDRALSVDTAGCYIEQRRGDTNLDGDRDIRDLIRLKKYFAGQSGCSVLNADCNGSLSLDVSDIAAYKRTLLGDCDAWYSGAFSGESSTGLGAAEEALRINSETYGADEKIASEHVTVSDYNSSLAFTHHPQVTYFKGRIYCTWSAGAVNEDDVCQVIMISSSSDFYNFSEPQVLAYPSAGDYHERLLLNGFIHNDGQKLYITYREMEYTDDQFDSDGSLILDGDYNLYFWRDYVITSSDGVNWSEPVKASYSANEGSRQTATGLYAASSGNRMIFSQMPDGLNWKRLGPDDAQINDAFSRGASCLVESSFFQTPDLALHLILRSNNSVYWHTASFDNGNTWSDIYPTSFSSAATMPYFGRLPDGRYFFVGSTVYDRRYPLYLYISNDGINFNQRYVIRDEIYHMQQDGYAKGGEYGYSEVTIADGYMYIFYSKAKEVTELTRIKLSDIPYKY